ncbi:ribosome-associated translation inhibitor RaiA [Candidatus Saccharibacteria bacterium]|nr:ribosome-associated translation inhibitor RaiA [Candidatus Saccharibacteria bacterium]
MKYEIQGKNYEIGGDIRKYIEKMLKSVEKTVPRHAKKTVHATVTLSESRSKKPDRFEAEVMLHLPHDDLIAKERTVNIFAATDIVEEKLKNQVRKYKTKHSVKRSDRKGILRKFRKDADRDWWGRQN